MPKVIFKNDIIKISNLFLKIKDKSQTCKQQKGRQHADASLSVSGLLIAPITGLSASR